ncbi:MAG: amidohydrolase, partial [Candidatus Eremiobacteraeota bacterium]|nr:amidohydrolase [Candidatus Eremiobacteraeota bacterium]
DFTGEELAENIRRAGVDRTVIVQAGDNVEDAAFMAEQARRFPFIAGIVGWLPLDDPRATERQLETYATNPKIKGFRHMIIWEADADWLVRPTVLESLRLVAERGLSWDTTATNTRHLEHVSTLAQRVPALRQVIDHLGKPEASTGRWEPWASLMARAASHPNVSVKLSGLYNVFTNATASAGEFRPYVEHVLEHFGPRRVMIASNWPPSLLGDDYPALWRKTVAFIENLAPEDRDAILGATATHFYRLTEGSR